MTNLRDVKDFKDLANVPNLNEQVIEDFRANGGRVGGPYEGAPIILVHHVGAKTGMKRVSPMMYFPQEDGRMVIVASHEGEPKNPAWYHNLMANPRTDVEVSTETFSVVVNEITGEERDAVWADILTMVPALGEFQKMTTRTIPVLRLTRMN
ncbi:nitroreductase family deazaflavin-dependent oxidoreductase [Protofrankia symbiont of Coriaria ruscifolia]|uniref:nitroreductase family deazaflavin-dependent oxidoreductase n=1 Tax=Protofrankia symbiont of Coriaria ruscifolia TaxID=1306542 RepID=UPI001041454C|nr:nitroreductase family deazaflavin-dependent oxidoreductase [Protofrankia symbiont of Coriaria ruscifolia]